MTRSGATIAANGGAAGGPERHLPVMLDEVLSALDPAPGKLVVDGTFGAGGYSRAILERGARVLAIDRDPAAIEAGRELADNSGGMLVLVQGRFGRLDELAHEAGFVPCDGVVLDIGVSSMQLDEAKRGFSFRRDGPLDMRMEQSGVSAADVVNRAAGGDLARIIGMLGEERQAARIARAIVAQREKKPFDRTLELAGLVESVVGRRSGERIHPATRTFQALRIFVNRELEELGDALRAAERILRAGGRLAVVTFHSLEDRIVKQFFAERSATAASSGSRHLPPAQRAEPSFRQVRRRLVSRREAEANPRARSAKLRHGIRTEAPARDDGLAGLLPRLAALESFAGS